MSIIPALPGIPHPSTSVDRVFLPPPGFLPAEGVREARLLPVAEQAALRSSPDAKASIRAGLRYEAKALAMLRESWQRLGDFLPGPWISFEDKHGVRRCQPDALLVTEEHVLIVEIKHTHTQNAWWQLRRLYEPVVRALDKRLPIYVCEVCKFADPHAAFPEEICLWESPAVAMWPGKFNVLMYNPREDNEMPADSMPKNLDNAGDGTPARSLPDSASKRRDPSDGASGLNREAPGAQMPPAFRTIPDEEGR